MWLCSREFPRAALVDGNATFTDASENEKVLCIVELNPLEQIISNGEKDGYKWNEPVQTVDAMENSPTDIKSVMVGQNLSRRILMQAQINRNFDSHTNQIPTAKAGRINKRILSKQ